MGISMVPINVQAIVMRHDTEDVQYQLTEPPAYLVDLPHEGHGVLIHPRWVVTVAHSIFYDYRGLQLDIANQ